MSTVELHGPRVHLREYAHGDAVAVHAFATHPRIAGTGGDHEPPGVDMVQAMLDQRIELARADDRQTYELAIVVDGQMIGSATLSGIDREHQRAELGYIVHPDWWGHGYATEAAALLVDFGFGRLGLHRIEAGTAADNPGSRRVLEKIGMRFEGVARESVRVKGEWHDSMIFAVLRGDRRAEGV